jgi:hypothetical protein
VENCELTINGNRGGFLKKAFMASLILIIIFLITFFCSSENFTTVTSQRSIKGGDNCADITIKSPMTLSNNSLYPVSGKNQHLRVKMFKGKYYEDWVPGAYMGTIWEGSFYIELDDDNGNIITQTDLSKFYKETLTFNSSFQIQFDDYNNDGDIDFTIGQYASSNGKSYKLFTLSKDGRVEEMAIKDYHSLFISNTTETYSTKLTKVNSTTFKTGYYNNLKGKQFEEIFRWDGKQFIRINEDN